MFHMSIDYEAWKQVALECGFSHVGDLTTDTIDIYPKLREACAADKCNKYGKNWMCPPACGTIEECEAHLRKYTRGLIVQSTAELEDEFDWEGIEALAKRHAKIFDTYADKVREQFPNALILGDSACGRCETCTYPDAPCRFPERQSSSISAYGIFVSEVCKRNNILYSYGKGTMTYIGFILLE